MIDVMIEISVYIFAAIVLGYFFGWLTTRLALKKRYQAKLDEIVLTKQLTSDDDKLGKETHDKDELISTLTSKLALMKEKSIEIEKKYEEEIDAFLTERVEIIQKYKSLVAKTNAPQNQTEVSTTDKSWFTKLFSSSPSID